MKWLGNNGALCGPGPPRQEAGSCRAICRDPTALGPHVRPECQVWSGFLQLGGGWGGRTCQMDMGTWNPAGQGPGQKLGGRPGERRNGQSDRQGTTPSPQRTLAGRPPGSLPVAMGVMSNPKGQQCPSASAVPGTPLRGPRACHSSGLVPPGPLLAPAVLDRLPLREHVRHACTPGPLRLLSCPPGKLVSQLRLRSAPLSPSQRGSPRPSPPSPSRQHRRVTVAMDVCPRHALFRSRRAGALLPCPSLYPSVCT